METSREPVSEVHLHIAHLEKPPAHFYQSFAQTFFPRNSPYQVIKLNQQLQKVYITPEQKGTCCDSTTSPVHSPGREM
jgi:hypothetical protein